jgi:hypothetical protein
MTITEVHNFGVCHARPKPSRILARHDWNNWQSNLQNFGSAACSFVAVESINQLYIVRRAVNIRIKFKRS